VSVVLEVDLAAAVPPYEQIRAQVAGHVAGGRLRPGDRLPTVRALAADLGVAAGTVARAYRELESAGVVSSRRRVGTVVTGPAPAPALEEVRRAADRLARVARDAGLDDGATLDLLRSVLTAPAAPAVHERADRA
jgi:GntR family transcriptional regulator